MNAAATDYKQVLTEVLQKQMVILGPAITLAKVKHVDGLEIDDHGNVKSLSADGHAVSVKVLEQFRELSPRLVKKTMRPLLSAILYPANAPQTPIQTQPIAVIAAQTEEEQDVQNKTHDEHEQQND